MGTVDGNIEALSQAILSEARAETEEVRSRASAKAVAIGQRAEEAARQERQAILERARQEVRRLRGQAIATAQMKARALQLERRERLLSQVFDAVAEELAAVPSLRDYGTVVKSLVREGIAQLRTESVEVRADTSALNVLTKPALEDLSRETGTQISIGKPLDDGIGVIVGTTDGRLQFDNRLQTRLNRMQATLRAAAYKLLMGEAG